MLHVEDGEGFDADLPSEQLSAFLSFVNKSRSPRAAFPFAVCICHTELSHQSYELSSYHYRLKIQGHWNDRKLWIRCIEHSSLHKQRWRPDLTLSHDSTLTSNYQPMPAASRAAYQSPITVVQCCLTSVFECEWCIQHGKAARSVTIRSLTAPQ